MKLSFNSGDYTANEFAIAQLLMDEYNMKILAATSYKARSARELAFMFDIPLASCYRKLRELAAAGIMKLESTELTPDGKRYKVYRSQIDYVTLVYEKGKVSMKVDIHLKSPLEIVRNMATPLQKEL